MPESKNFIMWLAGIFFIFAYFFSQIEKKMDLVWADVTIVGDALKADLDEIKGQLEELEAKIQKLQAKSPE